MKPYDPRTYWEDRLSKHFNLKGVGHVSFSESYNHWLYRRKYACIESLFRDRSLRGKDVLDIGCGTGFFVRWYIERGANVYGVDITQTSIQYLSKRFPGDFMVMDISDANYFPPKICDVVNAWDVIYHIVDTEGFHQSLTNIAKSCRKGALLLLTDWLGAPFDVRVAPHVKFRCLSTYQSILSDLGFDFIELRPLYNFLNTERMGRLDNFFAPAYFILDNHLKVIPHSVM